MAAKTPDTNRIDFVTGAPVRYIALLRSVTDARDRIDTLLSGATNESMRRAPAGEWSSARHLGHLIGYARHQHENLYRMTWQTDPIFNAWDDAAEAERNAWESRSHERLRGWFDEAVGRIVTHLQELPDSSWGRPGQHPEFGRRSISQQVERMVAHMQEHADAIERALAVPAR